MFIKYIKIMSWLAVYITTIGLILPELFSASSNIAIVFGIIITIALIFRVITFIPWNKIINFLRNLYN